MAERPRLLLSDLDDTLVETRLEDYHMELRGEWAQRLGIALPDEEYRQEVRSAMGGPGGEVIASLYPQASRWQQDRLLADFRAKAKADKEPARPIPGARSMVKMLRQRDVRIGLLTNRSSALDDTLRTGGLSRRHFNHVEANVGERFGSKLPPAQRLVAKYALKASQVVMLGDSVGNDMKPFRTGLSEDEHVTLAFVPKLILHEPDARSEMAHAQELGAFTFRTLAECGEWMDELTRV